MEGECNGSGPSPANAQPKTENRCRWDYYFLSVYFTTWYRTRYIRCGGKVVSLARLVWERGAALLRYTRRETGAPSGFMARKKLWYLLPYQVPGTRLCRLTRYAGTYLPMHRRQSFCRRGYTTTWDHGQGPIHRTTQG